MKINVKVIPGAKRNVIHKNKDIWKIYLTAPPVNGKANKALITLLAKRYKVRKSAIHIIKGLKSRLKTITIEDDFDD